MIGKSISHYKILEKLGEGGMGVVYKAEDTKLKRTVALKFLPPEVSRDATAKERFIHEAQAASSLEHTNICNIHEIDETKDGQLFIVMACYDGESLKKKIEGGPLKFEEALDVAIQVARGLAKAHEKGIVHRDIKPANIHVTNDGVVKILDFGLAKLGDRSKITKEGTTLGTVVYMSPEQAHGEKVDSRTDIWSLGVVLYEMITGQIPFKGEYEQAIVYSIINENPKPMITAGSGRTSVPMELERITNKALAKKPEERYQLVDELLIDLKQVKKETDKVSSESSRRIYQKMRHKKEKPTKTIFGKKRVFAVTAIALSVLILAVLSYLLFFSRSKEPTERFTLAVADINNETNEDELNSISGMFITALDQSRHLDVLSRSRMSDILKQMNKQNVNRITEAVGRDLCKHANITTLILTTIRKFGKLPMLF